MWKITGFSLYVQLKSKIRLSSSRRKKTFRQIVTIIYGLPNCILQDRFTLNVVYLCAFHGDGFYIVYIVYFIVSVTINHPLPPPTNPDNLKYWFSLIMHS